MEQVIIINDDGSRPVPLTKGKFAIVDDEDFEFLSQWNWQFDGRYAVRFYRKNSKLIKVYMHRVILNTPKDKSTDHINGCKLDNRKQNLRLCNAGQNGANREGNKVSSSKFKGVGWDKKYSKWKAQIQINGKSKNLGLFTSEKCAAIAYNNAAKLFFGDFARLNRIGDK